MSGWTKMKDMLPSKPGTYLVVLGNRRKASIQKMRWDGNGWVTSNPAWMGMFGPVTKWKKRERHND